MDGNGNFACMVALMQEMTTYFNSRNDESFSPDRTPQETGLMSIEPSTRHRLVGSLVAAPTSSRRARRRRARRDVDRGHPGEARGRSGAPQPPSSSRRDASMSWGRHLRVLHPAKDWMRRRVPRGDSARRPRKRSDLGLGVGGFAV